MIDEKLIEPGDFEAWLSNHPRAWAEECAAEVCDRLETTLQQRYHARKRKLLTFDVFDTLLLRDSKCEEERFHEVATLVSGGDAGLAREVFLSRLFNHHLAYKVGVHCDGVPEPRLIEVLAGTVALLESPRPTLPAMLAAELEFERRSLRANPYLRKFLQRSKLEKVIAITDVYLVQEHVLALLRHHYSAFEFLVFSSSTERLSKRAGTLYSVVIRTLNCVPDEMLHMGDNFSSDVRCAKNVGLSAIHLPIPLSESNARELRRASFFGCFERTYGLTVAEACGRF